VPYVLIADDNKQIADVLSEYIKKEGYEPVVAYDGNEAVRKFREYAPEMILLDVMMPLKDGFEVCREIRKTSEVPIIMITARGEDFEKIMGLDIGADDYIVKPFSPGEVMARMRAILRRLQKTDEKAPGIFNLGDLFINIDDYTVTVNNNAVPLTKKEIEILWTLATNRNKVFTRENLLSTVWGYEYFGDARTVDSHIKRLRAKLDGYGHKNWEISTMWGIGYKFEVKTDE
jgi:two-component system, OmpR family, response regulator ResD